MSDDVRGPQRSKRRRRQQALVANPTTTESERASNAVQAERLTIKQTATGYWVVERGAVQLAGGTTRRYGRWSQPVRRRSSRSRGTRVLASVGSVARRRGNGNGSVLACDPRYTRSKIAASPCPPPMHIVSRP